MPMNNRIGASILFHSFSAFRLFFCSLRLITCLPNAKRCTGHRIRSVFSHSTTPILESASRFFAENMEYDLFSDLFYFTLLACHHGECAIEVPFYWTS